MEWCQEGEMGTEFQFCEMKESWKSTEPKCEYISHD